MRHTLPKLLITGGAGFIGSAFVRHAAALGHHAAVVDMISYAGDTARIAPVMDQITFYKTDIRDLDALEKIFKKERPDAVVHFAAETHVDRSILDVTPFITTNIQGTAGLIRLCRRFSVKKFIHLSTDEVYGEIKKGFFTEYSPLHPNNPYSATKAAADLLLQAAIRTYSFPAVIVRPCNNYGPWQYPEKFIPVILLKTLRGQKIPVYGKGLNIREWLYVDDCAKAVFCILEKGKPGEIYNISSGQERSNIQVVKSILSVLNAPQTLIDFIKDRPGHDFRYASDCAKLRKLGWREDHVFETGLEKTILWAEEHLEWMTAKAASLKGYWKTVYKRK